MLGRTLPSVCTLCLLMKMSHVLVKHGCQMVYFQTKNPNLGKFLKAYK
jgi:hypothetical protein